MSVSKINDPFDRRLTEVLLSNSAYLTKRGQNGKDGVIDEEGGLHDWTSEETLISVYFYAKTAVKFDLLIKCKVLPNGESKLQATLDGTSHVVSIIGTEFHTFPIGSFEVKSKGYHKIDLKGVQKSGTHFANVSALVFGESSAQPSIEGIAQNIDRGTPAIHLWIDTPNPKNVNIEYYYTEVNVVKGYDTIGTYFMAVGFNVGYFGIQVNSEKERRILFSVWAPQNTQDPHKITDENKIKLITKGKNVIVEDFGGEGSGGHSILKYNWTPDITYKFLVRGRPNPTEKTHTIYTAWFAGSDGIWQLIASFERPKGGQYLDGYYSFLEEFDPDNAYLSRKARYGNQWLCDKDGNWSEVTGAIFNGNQSAHKKYRLDFDGGVETYQGREYFYLKNGGFFEGKTPLETHLVRKANNIKPTVDLKKLP